MRILLPAALLLAATTLLAEPLRVLSYNVRLPSPSDGPNVWEQRRDILVDSIRQARPDLIGTQELYKLQGDYIVRSLPGYSWFGTSRRGNSEDEHMGIFYRSDRLKLVEHGHFWLSETPDVAGSQSWGASLPRMVMWGLFEGEGKRFYLLNTHFAHRDEDEQARRKSVEVIGARMRALRNGLPVSE